MTSSDSLQETDVERLIDRYRPAVTSELRSVLERRSIPPYSLMRYHLGWEDRYGGQVEARSGKQLRPTLCLLCCEAIGGDWQRALPAAAAIELLHNFTLIHDDVEDASPRRHGRETIWSLWGQAQAINVGDGMFALSHQTLLRLDEHGFAPKTVLRAVELLDEATLRLCEGQHRDLVYSEQREVNLDGYLAMIEGKTAALLAASSGMGALLGDASPEAVNALLEFGRRLGLAFQIQDDVLGIWGLMEETGKPTGDDLRQGKKSYPVVIALERASPAERGTLLDLLAEAEVDAGAVEGTCELLERLGAREDGERAAVDHAEAAIARLADAPLHPERRQELELLARFAAQRHS
ncbi:MAG: polyprenyl synthetase family protein [Dehalococcoidia bacterium]